MVDKRNMNTEGGGEADVGLFGEKPAPQCQSIYYKFRMDWRGFNPRISAERPATYTWQGTVFYLELRHPRCASTN
jgi:hypothetical protein